MKQKLLTVVALIFLATGAFAQKAQKRNLNYPSDKKGQLFGLHFNLADFNAPISLQHPGLGVGATPIKDMGKGFSLSYWRGITKKIDFSGRVNAMFYDYAANFQGVTGKTEIGLEVEPSIHLRPINDDNLWSPFLTLGLGGGLYTNKIGAYIPAGLGLQLNLNGVAYFFGQANYRYSLTPSKVEDQLFYSVGFAQSFGREEASMPPPPPPPVVADRDGDGVMDTDDKCPDTKGLSSLMGCPDSDSDGIADGDDKCPNRFGTAKYNGCPVPDTDGDGINDEDDKCVNRAGVARYQGCPVPDGDSDGVNDEDDKCPTTPGPASNMGCPEIKEEVKERVALAAKNVYFETGSAKLLAKSFKSLNEVAQIMSENPGAKLDIEGHTDNVGDETKNQALSESRAEAVKAYLASKGVNEDDMTATGYGPSQPAADNGTAAGRAKNRRVELKIKSF